MSSVRRSTWLTWLVPPVLAAVSAWVAWLSIRLAPGERPGQETVDSTPALDLVLFGLTIVSWVACVRWHRSALLTAAGSIGVLLYYTDLLISSTTNQMAGVAAFVTFPLAAISGTVGLVAFFGGRSANRDKTVPTGWST